MMKKSVLISAMIGFSLMGCTKESSTNTEPTATQMNSLDMDVAQDYSYMATDNSRANVTFQNKGVDHTMTIKSNNMKYVLDKKEGKANSEIYERNGVIAELTKDSLFITQDNKVIPLVRMN